MIDLDFKRVRDQITDHLRHEILTGQLSEGAPLREVRLAERFQVSRGPIRDAILQLTKEGLLESLPNRGARVGRVWDDSLRPLMLSMRGEIETLALRGLLDLGSKVDLKPFHKNQQNLRIACEEGDLAAVVKYDMEFHRLILKTCDHPGVESVWLSIMSGMRLPYSRHKNLMEVHAEHGRVLECMERGDAEAALEAFQANIH
ncbi:MAG: GntR family transcriptional regulator [Opitutae bacterium]|nr:GntR family transcriptional regulator [Opitutae bacterium]